MMTLVMDQHPLYIGIRYNQYPYPILFKKIPDVTVTKETLISKGELLTKSISETTYFGIFDDNSKPIMVCDFENGNCCGELSLDNLNFIIL